MRFEALPLEGAYRIRLDKHEDERGHFARTYCDREFARAGLKPLTAQCNTSFNRKRGTLRGLHWQAEPHAEAKLVRVTRGALFDVLVDIRPDSRTFKRWHGETLTADLGVMLYIPEGFAHGFLTLAEETELAYQMSVDYHGASARGARYDDPAFGIAWPDPGSPLILSERDLAFPSFSP